MPCTRRSREMRGSHSYPTRRLGLCATPSQKAMRPSSQTGSACWASPTATASMTAHGTEVSGRSESTCSGSREARRPGASLSTSRSTNGARVERSASSPGGAPCPTRSTSLVCSTPWHRSAGPIRAAPRSISMCLTAISSSLAMARNNPAPIPRLSPSRRAGSRSVRALDPLQIL